MYADYNFYLNTFHGDILSETDFEKYADKASVQIDKYTFGRIAGSKLSDLEKEAVKRAECECADKIFLYRTDNSANLIHTDISEESVGDYSVTYRSGSEISAAKSEYQRDIYNIIKDHLWYTGLMYRGD